MYGATTNLTLYTSSSLSCAANCGVPVPPDNGTILNYTSSLEGLVVYYQCDSGFGPLGEMSAVCAANGGWSPDPADVTCREVGMHYSSYWYDESNALVWCQWQK